MASIICNTYNPIPTVGEALGMWDPYVSSIPRNRVITILYPTLSTRNFILAQQTSYSHVSVLAMDISYGLPR